MVVMKAEAKVRYYCNSTVAELPCEIFFNIFLKLHVKSLLMSKCVCKSWRQLLSDPYFAKLHINRINQPQSQKLLLRSYDDSFYSLDCESTHGNAVFRKFPLKAYPPVDVLSSCNGLLCVAVPHKSQESPHRQLVEVVLWNPTTGDHKTLPSAKPSVDGHQVVGFGYHPSLDDYMMVRIITHDFIDSEEKFRRIEGEHRVDTYSLRTNSWKRIQDSPGHGFITKAGSYGANGSIYWGGRYSTVIRFDLKGEKFSVFQMPNDIEGGPRCVLTRGGCLWLYYTVPLPQCNNIVLWTMKEDENKKEQWTKLMTISSPREKIDRGRAIGPTCFLENGKLLRYKAKRISKDDDFERSLVINFVVYDPKKNSMPETFPIYGISGFWMWETYTESFVSPNSIS